MIKLTRIYFFLICLLVTGKIYGSNLHDMIANLIITKLETSNIKALDLNFDNKSKYAFTKYENIEIKDVQLTYFAPNYSSFRVTVETKEGKQFDLFGRYNAYIDVPLTSRSLTAGTIVTEADINTARIPKSKVTNGYILSQDDVIGLQVKKGIGAGALIRQGDLVKPQVIHPGDNVSITYNTENIKLRTSGIAIQTGAIGDNIKVKNESTGTIVNGIVKAKNLIEVNTE